MSSLHETCQSGLWKRLALVGLAGQALSCSPSDFDALTDETRDPAECAEAECWDSGSVELDAGQDDDPHADVASDELDSATEPADGEWPDTTTIEAPVEEPADAETGQARDASPTDASPDASPRPPDSGPGSQMCNGAPPPCRANELERQMEACGNCGRGVRTRTRSCAADGCSWGAWGAWSACSNQVTECDPSAPAQTQTVSCTTCGTRTQSRSCSRDTCTWGPWSDTSACSWCEECSEVVYCDTPASIADRGTWCRQKACTRQQALGDCMEDIQSACGATTQPFYMQYL
jgi:hypothetical protein